MCLLHHFNYVLHVGWRPTLTLIPLPLVFHIKFPVKHITLNYSVSFFVSTRQNWSHYCSPRLQLSLDISDEKFLSYQALASFSVTALSPSTPQQFPALIILASTSPHFQSHSFFPSCLDSADNFTLRDGYQIIRLTLRLCLPCSFPNVGTLYNCETLIKIGFTKIMTFIWMTPIVLLMTFICSM